MRDTEIDIGRKTYRVYSLDVGQGPKQHVSVRVPVGPRGVIVSHVWRAVPRDGPTWKRVMKRYESE